MNEHHLIIVVFVDRAFETGHELLWDSGIESLLHLLTDRGFEPGKRTAINCRNRILMDYHCTHLWHESGSSWNAEEEEKRAWE